MHILKNRWVWLTTLFCACALPLKFLGFFQGRDFKDYTVEFPALSSASFSGGAAWGALSISFGIMGFLVSSVLVSIFSKISVRA